MKKLNIIFILLLILPISLIANEVDIGEEARCINGDEYTCEYYKWEKIETSLLPEASEETSGKIYVFDNSYFISSLVSDGNKLLTIGDNLNLQNIESDFENDFYYCILDNYDLSTAGFINLITDNRSNNNPDFNLGIKTYGNDNFDIKVLGQLLYGYRKLNNVVYNNYSVFTQQSGFISDFIINSFVLENDKCNIMSHIFIKEEAVYEWIQLPSDLVEMPKEEEITQINHELEEKAFNEQSLYDYESYYNSIVSELYKEIEWLNSENLSLINTINEIIKMSSFDESDLINEHNNDLASTDYNNKDSINANTIIKEIKFNSVSIFLLILSIIFFIVSLLLYVKSVKKCRAK